jgi:hypothetical protein
LPLLLAVESRLTARRSALEAGGVATNGEAKRPKKTKSRSVGSTSTTVWVPGLPFESSRKPTKGGSPKKKNRH